VQVLEPHAEQPSGAVVSRQRLTTDRAPFNGSAGGEGEHLERDLLIVHKVRT
jgi:hypothetical protein